MIASSFTSTVFGIQEDPYYTGTPFVFFPYADSNCTVSLTGNPKKVPMHKPVPLPIQGRLLMRRRVKLYPRYRLPAPQP